MNAVIGIDLGSYSVKAVLLEKKNGVLTCTSTKTINLHSDDSEKKVFILDALKQISLEYQKITPMAVLVSSDREIALKFFEKPAMSRENLGIVLSNEFKALSAGHEQSEKPPRIEYAIVGQNATETGPGITILTASFPDDLPSRYFKLFKQANLRLIGIYPYPVAARECFHFNYSDDIEKHESPYLISFINFGAISNQVIVCDLNNLKLARTFPFAGEELTQSLVKKYKVDQNEVMLDKATAEAYKTTIGMLKQEEIFLYNPGALEVQVSELIKRAVSQMIQKIRLSLDYFKGQMKTEVSRAYIFGGGAIMRGMSDSLGKLLMVNEVFELSPFVKVPYLPGKSISSDAAAEQETQEATPLNDMSFVLAVGGALCAFRENPESLNILGELKEDLSTKIIKQIKSCILQIIAVIVAIVLPIIYYQFIYSPQVFKSSKLQKETAAKKAELDAIMHFKAKHDEMIAEEGNLKTRSGFIQNIIKKRIFWSKALKKLISITPDDLWITEISAGDMAAGDGASGGGMDVTQNTSGGGDAGGAPASGGSSPAKSAKGKDSSLKLKGKSLKYSSLARFLKDLEESKTFNSITWEESKRSQSKKGSEIDFSLACKIDLNALQE
ncbi:MAG: pilus assembly protein PilM [Candidatus Riflebacteria bacterium]|nr:pilus assembly protein PilM [Candidatus Riflebacteria bacterium]